jgi:CRP-like cAMP-binding protein
MSTSSVSTGSLIANAVKSLGDGRKRRNLRVPTDLLAQVPLFAGLSRRHLRKLAAMAQEVHYRKGRVIVEVGQPGNSFYVIVDGIASVYPRKLPTGRPRARLRGGDFFGELALLDGGPRTATVVSDGDLVVLRLSRSSFHKLVTTEPSVAEKIMAGLAGRIRKGATTE